MFSLSLKAHSNTARRRVDVRCVNGPLRLRRYKRKSKVGVYRRGGSLSADISRGKGQLRATPVGAERLEISLFRMVIDDYFILSQYMYLSDKQNCDSNTVRCITCSRTITS